MDERRFRAVLEDITATIEDYGEETVIAAFRTVLDRFNYEVVKRDPGPCCDYACYYESEGIMTPIHECPSEAPSAGERFDEILSIVRLESDGELVRRAFGVDR